MLRLFNFLISLYVALALTPAAALSEDSYYFFGSPSELRHANELEVSDWAQPIDVIKKDWISETNNRPAKFDLKKFPLNQLVDAKLDHLGLLAYNNVVLLNSSHALEKLVELIVHGDPSIDKNLHEILRARAILVLYKLKPQQLETIKPLLKVLVEHPHFRMRQVIAGIFVKASPRLDAHTVGVLKSVMKKDADSPTRSLATLAVVLNSENNEENLAEAVTVMMKDQRDIMKMLRPWYVVRTFMEQKKGLIVEAPSRPIEPGLKDKLLNIIKKYPADTDSTFNWANEVKFYMLFDQQI